LVKRRNWLIAAFTALFVLQAPLCVLACLPLVESATAVAGAEHGESPCHETAPSSDPSEPANSHDDCGCEDSYTAIVASADQNSGKLSATPLLPPKALAVDLHASASWVPRAHPKETDLPPPDILLLNTTLLI